MNQPESAPLAEQAGAASGRVSSIPSNGAELVDEMRRPAASRHRDKKDGPLHRAGRRADAPSRPPGRPSVARRARRRRNWKGYLFVSPAVVLFLAFIAVPIAGIIVFSFLQWDLLTPPKFAGLANFRMLAHDPQLAQALFNSLIFDLMTTSLHIIVGMTLAIAVTSVSSRVVRYWARTAFVVPFLMSAGAVAVMWGYILSGSTGPLNYYLERLGMNPPDWLASGTWALPSLVGVDLWQTVGITFIIFLVGLQTIPSVLYEAAAIDGVGPWQRFRHITFPMLSPATLVASVTAFIGAFEIFTWPYVITNGGPGNATLTIMVYIFRVAFRNLQLGYGAAVSIVNLVVLVTLVMIGLTLARRWVHYERV
jgi:multiple sugar transport system permease protein